MRLPCLLAFAAILVPLAARSQPPTHPNGLVVHSSTFQTVQSPEPTPQDGQELVPVPEATSERSGSLALADVEQMALQNNPSLAQAYARVEAARGIWLQVGLYPNPVAGYVAEEMGDEGTAGLQGGFIGQQLVTAGKLRLNRQVACQEVNRL
jgi:outer membrane protein TolC